MKLGRTVFLVAALMGQVPSMAAEGPPAESGFLSDYALLQPSAAGQVGSWIYVAPNAVDRLGGFNAVLLDQPGFAVATGSDLKAIKPDDVKLIADTFRQVLGDELATSFQIVDRAGPGVLEIRTSFSNVYLDKKRRGVLGYTPVGLVVGTAKRALVDDVMDKVKLQEVVIEVEIVDGVSGEVLAAVIDQRGHHSEKKEHASWNEVEAALDVYAKRLKCHLDNARVQPEGRQDCTVIVATAP